MAALPVYVLHVKMCSRSSVQLPKVDSTPKSVHFARINLRPSVYEKKPGNARHY